MIPNEVSRTLNTFGAVTDQLGDAFPMFFSEAVPNEAKSIQAGRPIYDKKDMVRIVIPGDPTTCPVRLVTPADKERWPQYWEAFERQQEMVFEGTILEAWPILDKAQVAGLKAIGIHTVEHLAGVKDSDIPRLGLGGLTLRDQARAFVDASKNGGVPERLVSENNALREQMAGMSRTIADLKVLIEQIARQPGSVNISAVTDATNSATSHAREILSEVSKPIPENWREMKTAELLKLCETLNPPMRILNRGAALSFLEDYEGKRAAVAPV